jgi:DNA modification methylase
MLGEIAGTVLLDFPSEGGKAVFLDPMCGSGTAPLFAHYLGYTSIGIDSNPLATLITKTKLLAGTGKISATEISEQVSRSWRGVRRPELDLRKEALGSEMLRFWFWPSVLDELLMLRRAIDESGLEPLPRLVALVALSRSVRQVSKADPEVVPPTISKRRRTQFAGRPLSPRKAFRSNLRYVADVVSNSKLQELRDLPAHALRADAMRLPLRSHTVDLSLFSPPYGNAHDYIRSTRLERLVLGLVEAKDTLREFPVTVGRHRTGLRRFETAEPIGLTRSDGILVKLSRRSEKRAKFLRHYLLQMKAILSEVHRVLRPTGALVLVVGDGSSCGLKIPLGQLLIEIAEAKGFTLDGRPCLNRIVSRGFMTKRNTTAGIIDREWILRFTA